MIQMLEFQNTGEELFTDFKVTACSVAEEKKTTPRRAVG